MITESGLDVSKPENNLLFDIVEGIQYNMDELRAIILYFLEQKMNINEKDEVGDTPLIKAIYGPRMDIAKLFIELGAEITLTDKKDNSPLHILLENSWQRDTLAEDVAFFVEHGADLALKNRDGLTPLALAKSLPFNYIPFYLYFDGMEWEAEPIDFVRGREMDRMHWRVMMLLCSD